MVNINRKLKRSAKKKADKNAKNTLKGISEKISEMPSQCSSCKKKFDNKLHLDTWRVIISSGLFSLLCPDCQEENNVNS